MFRHQPLRTRLRKSAATIGLAVLSSSVILALGFEREANPPHTDTQQHPQASMIGELVREYEQNCSSALRRAVLAKQESSLLEACDRLRAAGPSASRYLTEFGSILAMDSSRLVQAVASVVEAAALTKSQQAQILPLLLDAQARLYGKPYAIAVDYGRFAPEVVVPMLLTRVDDSDWARSQMACQGIFDVASTSRHHRCVLAREFERVRLTISEPSGSWVEAWLSAGEAEEMRRKSERGSR